MEKLFTDECLEINIWRNRENNLILSISSDYSGSDRKQRLYVDKDMLAKHVENDWKAIKTKMILEMHVDFGEIDWYDDMTDMYNTPVGSIKRGLKKARMGYQEHGSIPKEWSFNFRAAFKDTRTITPFIETIEVVLGKWFTPERKSKFTKEARKVLTVKKEAVKN